jgi:hypothetical protein
MTKKILICTDKYSSLLAVSETNVTLLCVVLYSSVQECCSKYGIAGYVNATQNLEMLDSIANQSMVFSIT